MIEPFILFGEQHIETLTYTFGIIVLICLISNFISTSLQNIVTKIIGISLLGFEILRPFLYIFVFEKPWETYLPLHMCAFSAFLIGIFLLSKSRNQMFFELPYYWGVGGATMALATPDLTLGWPDVEYFFFFYGHGQILLGVFFALTVLKYRPHLQNFWRMAVITILLLIPVSYTHLTLPTKA